MELEQLVLQILQTNKGVPMSAAEVQQALGEMEGKHSTATIYQALMDVAKQQTVTKSVSSGTIAFRYLPFDK